MSFNTTELGLVTSLLILGRSVLAFTDSFLYHSLSIRALPMLINVLKSYVAETSTMGKHERSIKMQNKSDKQTVWKVG